MSFEWLSGPHAPYILGAYGISLVALLYTVLAPVFSAKKQRQQIAAMHRDQARH